MKFRKDEKLDVASVNDLVRIVKKILKIVFFLLIIIGVYALIKISQELSVKETFIVILKTIIPLFIGLFVAWLFDPAVSFLQSKGVKRGFGTLIVYAIFIGILALVLGSIIPLLTDQINDFVGSIPTIFEDIKDWIDNALRGLKKIDYIDVDSIKESLFKSIEGMGDNLSDSLPELVVNIVRSLVSGIGTFLIGLIIGFYFLISYNSTSDTIITLFPKKLQKDARLLFNEINTTFRRFINGSLIDCSLIFVISSIALWICGVKAPLLFGLFCGITNVIPYAGPYIGGAPAVIVGFSQSPTTGIFALIAIALIQAIEGNLLQPLIISKTTKLHPVTIIMGLLIFGHFFGILGMVISTPLIGAAKAIFMFFDEKYNILNFIKQ